METKKELQENIRILNIYIRNYENQIYLLRKLTEKQKKEIQDLQHMVLDKGDKNGSN